LDPFAVELWNLDVWLNRQKTLSYSFFQEHTWHSRAFHVLLYYLWHI
jgi:hypothetical protein